MFKKVIKYIFNKSKIFSKFKDGWSFGKNPTI